MSNNIIELETPTRYTANRIEDYLAEKMEYFDLNDSERESIYKNIHGIVRSANKEQPIDSQELDEIIEFYSGF